MVIALIFNVISAFYSRVSKFAKVELWQHYLCLGIVVPGGRRIVPPIRDWVGDVPVLGLPTSDAL